MANSWSFAMIEGLNLVGGGGKLRLEVQFAVLR
jgi:hypothetical protein